MTECPRCGSERDDERAIVSFVPEPNGSQRETRWARELKTHPVIVCTVCSSPVGMVVDPDSDHLEDVPDGVPDDEGSGFQFDGVAE